MGLQRYFAFFSAFFLLLHSLAPAALAAEYNISADTNAETGSGEYTALSTPIITETSEGQIGTGTIILAPPTGFEFKDQDATANVAEATSGSCSSTSQGDKVLELGIGLGSQTQTVSLLAGVYVFNVKTASKGNTCKLTLTNLEVRPTVGSPLGTSIITISGTSIITADIEDAILNLVDITPPTGNITINDSAQYTNSAEAELNFFDVSEDVEQIKLRNGTVGSYQSPVDYENPYSYTLPDGDGEKTVSVRFIDSAGNESEGVISDSIILDTTPPVITYDISGTLGNNDWYVDDITLTWNVEDPESDIAYSEGCETTIIDGDDPGSEWTCYAENGVGDSSEEYATTYVDKTPPEISFDFMDEPNEFGWHTGDVQVNWSCYDDTSGEIESSISQTITEEGENLSATGTCEDQAGNTSSDTRTGINIDKTPPTNPQLSVPDPIDLLNQVAAVFTISGETGTTYEYTVSDQNNLSFQNSGVLDQETVSFNLNLSEFTDGPISFLATLLDLAGNSSEETTAATKDTSGQAALSSEISSNLDLSANTEDISSTNTNYTSGNLNGVNLADVSIGGKNVTAEKAVKLIAGNAISLANNSLPNINVTIADNTTILAPTSWNGVIAPPSAASTTGTTAPSGFSVGSTVIEVGSPDEVLLFDTPVSIVLSGITGAVGYKASGSSTWVQIINTCGGTYDNPQAPTFPGECYISNGTDTKIYTYHFTTFANLVAASSNQSSNSSTSSSSTDTPVCTAAKPGSAPVLLPAISVGHNSATLQWLPAQNPVTYYLLTFGTSPGSQQYGNPYVGGSDAVSYTVNGLSGGTTYYFRLRAGNDCMPGGFSNEIAVTVPGAVLTTVPTGFEEGVLGEGARSSEVDNESETVSHTPEVDGAETSTEPTAQTGFFGMIKNIFTAILDFFRSLVRRG